MTLKECYQELGGSYDDVLGRLQMDSLVKRFALKFKDDPSYKLLTDSITAGDVPTAFRAAHTLKGVCQNLSFDTLYKSSATLTDALREKTDLNEVDNLQELLSDVTRDYELTIAAIDKLDA